jgi:hypothetical protein
MVTVAVCRDGASRIPLDEFPTTAVARAMADQ